VTSLPPPEITGLSDAAPTADVISETMPPGDDEALFGISFADVFRAEEFLMALRGMASRGDLKLNDAVVVYKSDDGSVRARETKDLQPGGTAVSGAMWTGLIGLLIGGPIGFVAGLGIGAGAGAITAKVVDIGIPDEWVDWFKQAVHPHTSTVVALASHVDLAKLYHEAQRFAGAELVHTTLRPGASADLAAALRVNR
jgi:uncharacterized membrane protein